MTIAPEEAIKELDNAQRLKTENEQDLKIQEASFMNEILKYESIKEQA